MTICAIFIEYLKQHDRLLQTHNAYFKKGINAAQSAYKIYDVYGIKP